MNANLSSTEFEISNFLSNFLKRLKKRFGIANCNLTFILLKLNILNVFVIINQLYSTKKPVCFIFALGKSDFRDDFKL